MRRTHSRGQALRLLAGPSVAALIAWPIPTLAQQAEPAAETSAEENLPTVTVSGTTQKRTGTEAEGYRVTDFNLGPLGNRPALDTPYSVQTVPQEMIANQGVTDNWELLKYLPSTQIEYRGGSEVGRPQSRGFQADLLGNTRIDGFAVQSHIPQPIELTDHLDVLNGLSGAFYGPMNPAGVFNYTLKRPTEETLNRAGIAYQSDGNVTTRADLGGRVGKDKMFGYRVNLAHSDGQAFSDSSNLRREVAGIALDARVTPDTVIEANAARYIYDRTGYPGSFAVATGAAATLPSANLIDPKAYGYDWAGVETKIDYYGAKVTHHFSPDWNVTGGLMRQNVTRVMRSSANRLNAAGSTYSVQASEGFNHWEVTSNQLYLNGKVETAGLKHELTLGTNGYVNPNFSAYNTAATTATTSGTCAVGNGDCNANPLNWRTDGGFYRTGTENRYQTLIVGDTMAINDQWSVLGVFSNGWITKESTTAGRETDMDDAKSYTVGLMYKPRPDMTVYANYSDSVNPDPGQAPTTAANANEFLAPFESKQWEVGYKVELSGVDVNLAGFRITRPTAWTGADNVYKVQGEQRNQGIELMTKGKLTDDVTLFGGVTWLNTRVTGTDNAGTDGKRAVGVPNWQANLLTEYKLPETLVTGTTASLNLHYTGERAANTYNTAWADGYVTVDMGLRFTGDAWGRKLMARLNVNNVFDERYWTSVFPSSIDGAGTASGSTAFIGEPRTFKASLSMDF